MDFVRVCGSLPNRAISLPRVDFSCTPDSSSHSKGSYTQLTHHNGLSQLLICAYLRQEDGHLLIIRKAHLCDSTSHIGSKGALNLNHQHRGNTSTAHHKDQNQAPPFKPQCAPSASIPQQHHASPRRALLPPSSRCPGMANLHLQLQQSHHQDAADRRRDHKHPSRAIRRHGGCRERTEL